MAPKPILPPFNLPTPKCFYSVKGRLIVIYPTARPPTSLLILQYNLSFYRKNSDSAKACSPLFSQICSLKKVGPRVKLNRSMTKSDTKETFPFLTSTARLQIRAGDYTILKTESVKRRRGQWLFQGPPVILSA